MKGSNIVSVNEENLDAAFLNQLALRENMIIRTAVYEDSGQLIEFNQAMAMETENKRLDAQTLNSGVEAVFQDEKKGFYVVAENDEKIIGGLMITFE